MPGRQVCPCQGGYAPPAFVGEHYFCDTGNPGPDWNAVWYFDRSLWDGDPSDVCATGSEPPRFHTTLAEPIHDRLEIRIMGDQCDENVAITAMELYVR